MVIQSAELAPPFVRAKRISYAAVAESMLLRPPETDQQERMQFMKLDQAAVTQTFRTFIISDMLGVQPEVSILASSSNLCHGKADSDLRGLVHTVASKIEAEHQ
jgi:hypothetical protein